MQGDLYGYFFRRSKKRIQIYIIQTGEKKTFLNKIEKNAVLTLLNKFKRLDDGLEEPIPPKAWKCKVCEYRKTCRYSQFKK